MAETFTDQEKTRILHFLSYPSWDQVVRSIQLGFPAASQSLFLVYQAFVNLTDGGASNARRDLCELESIEHQMSDARSRMRATSVGGVDLNMAETTMLRRELEYWTKRLEDDMGIKRNPYSSASYLGMGGGISGRVVG